MTLENISKNYGKKTILNNISFSAEKGDSIGILGINGSGKSTLLSSIAKLYSSNNSVSFGYVPQSNPLFDELKPIDNIRLWTKLRKKDILSALSTPPLSNLDITDFLDIPVSKMSGGMKKRLSLATVLINNPNILLLDEPFAALDLLAKRKILSYLGEFIRDDGTIIIASHEEEIFNFCNKVYLLKDGQLTDTAALRNQNINYIDILRS